MSEAHAPGTAAELQALLWAARLVCRSASVANSVSNHATTLVTGGTGFLGRHVVRALLARGRQVRLLCRRPEKARALFGEAVEVLAGDLLEAGSLRPACQGADTVLHLAGLYEFGARHRAALWRANVVGTEQLLAACWAARVGRVVHCSTAGILVPNGQAAEPAVFPGRPPMGCHYKRSKWEGELRALAWARRGLPVMIASPTALLGPEDERPTPSGRMVVDLLAGRFPCGSRTGLNVIAVEDVAAGLLAIAERGRAGTRYLLADRNLWLAELLQLIAAAAHVKAPRVLLPWPFIALAGLAGEVWGRVPGAGHSRLCLETAHFARRRQFFNAAATTAALGWAPCKSLESTVAESVAWARRRAADVAPVPARQAVSQTTA
jgi:dihydroflavonol-4-reductase